MTKLVCENVSLKFFNIFIHGATGSNHLKPFKAVSLISIETEAFIMTMKRKERKIRMNEAHQKHTKEIREKCSAQFCV